MSDPLRSTARRLAGQSLAKGDAVGWFETLYEQANGQPDRIPWADLAVNPHLSQWLSSQPEPKVTGAQRALVVGCGLGDDAEALAALGYQVVAFDVSSTAVEWCRRRFPASQVDYRVADLLKLPSDWQQSFALVVEIYTLQVLPPELRRAACAQMAQCVGPRGRLFLVARGREPQEDRGAMPWPLVRDELAYLVEDGMRQVSFDDFFDDEDPPVRRFRAVYERSA